MLVLQSMEMDSGALGLSTDVETGTRPLSGQEFIEPALLGLCLSAREEVPGIRGTN